MRGFLQIAAGFRDALSEMSPYLLLGFLAAGLLSVLVSPGAIRRHLGRRGLASIFKAALFGVPLPLCSCGVIPVAASLRRARASRGATTAFLISTPQTGVDSIMVTLSLLGPVFAVFRPVAALASGVLGGALVDLVAPDRGEDSPSADAPCAAPDGSGGKAARALRYGFVTLPRDIGKPLLAGLLVAALISGLVPEDFFAGLLGPGAVAILVMMLLGVPIYVCATGSVPIAAALLAKGVSPGAALAFLMTGPATNAATIVVVWKLMGARATVAYLAAILASGFLCGLALDWLWPLAGGAQVHEHVHSLLPGYVKGASAVLLAGLLGNALLRGGGPRKKDTGGAPEGDLVELVVTGMTCSRCREAVRGALGGMPGVSSVEVDLGSGRALVQGNGLDREALRRAVESLGYGAKMEEKDRG